MAKVSFSQYQLYSTCPRAYKLRYIDKLGESSANIYTIFGTAIHETIQHFLSVMYGVSKKQAMEIDTDKLLLDWMRKEFIKENDKLTEGTVCTQLELEEFYGDGRRIIEWFKKKIDKFYTKTGFELVGIEIPLNAKVKEGVNFIGFIDVLLKDKTTQDYIIIDLKTSTRGWNKYQKADKIKTSQMLLYKKFYSEKYDIPLDKIKVEYQILKRKLWEAADFPVPRISKFVPANGKPSVNRAWDGFLGFVNNVFGENGEIIQTDFPTNKGKHCDWCEFKERNLCPLWN